MDVPFAASHIFNANEQKRKEKKSQTYRNKQRNREDRKCKF